ncbi:MAG: sigma-70 family RNA polymerase sigma factor [Niabella sp.]
MADYTAHSDEDLLKAFRQSGDQQQLATLYMRYHGLVYGVCLKYLENAEDARDAAMNIYQELLKKLPAHEVSNFKSWLYVLVKNFCLMQLRAAKRNVVVNMDGADMQSATFLHHEDDEQKEATLRRMEQCLETLAVAQRQSIRLFYYENKCYKEIAATTGQEWNTVRSLIQNGRRNLKICMEKNNE